MNANFLSSRRSPMPNTLRTIFFFGAAALSATSTAATPAAAQSFFCPATIAGLTGISFRGQRVHQRQHRGLFQRHIGRTGRQRSLAVVDPGRDQSHDDGSVEPTRGGTGSLSGRLFADRRRMPAQHDPGDALRCRVAAAGRIAARRAASRCAFVATLRCRTNAGCHLGRAPWRLRGSHRPRAGKR